MQNMQHSYLSLLVVYYSQTLVHIAIWFTFTDPLLISSLIIWQIQFLTGFCDFCIMEIIRPYISKPSQTQPYELCHSNKKKSHSICLIFHIWCIDIYKHHFKFLAVVAAQAQIQHLRHLSAVFSPGIYTHGKHSLDLSKAELVSLSFKWGTALMYSRGLYNSLLSNRSPDEYLLKWLFTAHYTSSSHNYISTD